MLNPGGSGGPAGIQINPEAVEFLSQIKNKIGVIAICGKYRTGKSYIMNKLFIE
jgi:hypothetical protein